MGPFLFEIILNNIPGKLVNLFMPDNTKKKLAAIMFSKFVEFEKYLSEDENFAVKILSDHDKILEKQGNKEKKQGIKGFFNWLDRYI